MFWKLNLFVARGTRDVCHSPFFSLILWLVYLRSTITDRSLNSISIFQESTNVLTYLLRLHEWRIHERLDCFSQQS